MNIKRSGNNIETVAALLLSIKEIQISPENWKTGISK